MTDLKEPLFKVNRGDSHSYGGAQEWFKRKRHRDFGCGVIGCTNFLFQIQGKKFETVDKEEYMQLAEKLKHYMYVIPKCGLNGLIMAVGIDLYFIFHKMPYFAYWGCLPINRDRHIEGMLKENIPPVLAVGPNFPNFFGKHLVKLYVKRENGEYYSNSGTKGHYVSVTGIDKDWYRISTWGREMYIKREEYNEYIKKHSLFLFTSILVIKKIGPKRRNS